jgi:hypothetical protein
MAGSSGPSEKPAAWKCSVIRWHGKDRGTPCAISFRIAKSIGAHRAGFRQIRHHSGLPPCGSRNAHECRKLRPALEDAFDARHALDAHRRNLGDVRRVRHREANCGLAETGRDKARVNASGDPAERLFAAGRERRKHGHEHGRPPDGPARCATIVY